MDDRAHVLTTRSLDPVWDLELYELRSARPDAVPDLELFMDSGRTYAFSERARWSLVEDELDRARIAAGSTEEWYRRERPRLSDSLHARYPSSSYRRFEGTLFLTGDTVHRWLGEDATLARSDDGQTLAQLLKPGHWYLFVYDTEGSTHALGRRSIQRRAWFYVDADRRIQHWGQVRQRSGRMRIV